MTTEARVYRNVDLIPLKFGNSWGKGSEGAGGTVQQR